MSNDVPVGMVVPERDKRERNRVHQFCMIVFDRFWSTRSPTVFAFSRLDNGFCRDFLPVNKSESLVVVSTSRAQDRGETPLHYSLDVLTYDMILVTCRARMIATVSA